MIEMSLDNGFSKYSPLAFVFFSNFVLGQKRFQEANKFGKIALALLKRFDEPSLVPSVYISYYGFVAIFFEPLQLVAEQLRKGMVSFFFVKELLESFTKQRLCLANAKPLLSL